MKLQLRKISIEKPDSIIEVIKPNLKVDCSVIAEYNSYSYIWLNGFATMVINLNRVS